MTTITWDEVLSQTDLVDELVPPSLPKLRKLLSEPTIFDRPTPPPLRSVTAPKPLRSVTAPKPLPEAIKPKPLRQAVFGYDEEEIEHEAGFPTAEQEFTDEPLRPVSEDWLSEFTDEPMCGGFGQERPDGYRDSYFAGADLVKKKDRTIAQALEAAELGGRIYDDLGPVGGLRPDTIGRHAEPQTLYANHRDTPFGKAQEANRNLEIEMLEDAVTDAERRQRAAELFGIDPDTMTDDRMEGLR